MSWKCLPKIKGLVRGEPKLENGRRANGLKICMEAGKERASKSKTLDRERSYLNEYDGFTSGEERWTAMEETVVNYRIEGVNKNGKKFSRRLPPDTVLGFALLLKPPTEIAAERSTEKLAKFDADSMIVMNRIEPRLFRSENIRMSVKHRNFVFPEGYSA